MMNNKKIVVVIGGGAAGFFGAIACAEANSSCHVILLEKNRQVLSKVRISGGGRCNVTHACFDPAELIKHYPRGSKELRGPFSRFQPRDTIQWFESRGVPLKVEEDGRMFPISNQSESIISCLMLQANDKGVELKTEIGVIDCVKNQDGFILSLSNGHTLACHGLLIATGSAPKVYAWLQQLGHSIVPPVPSLFTFNIPNSPLNELAGISIQNVHLSIEGSSLQQNGPLLITHWGFSGPAVLKLSAWGARYFHDQHYRAKLKVNWVPMLSVEELKHSLITFGNDHKAKLVSSDSPVALPKNLWKVLLEMAGIARELRWGACSKHHLQQIVKILHECHFQIDGKSTYKDEFVTSGGVNLKEVNFKTMESKVCPGLYFAGEVLDIDGVTGGFNFQNAWTTSWIAGHDLARNLNV